MGMALGIDFSLSFADVGRQVGGKLASKIDKKSKQKKHPENDDKQKASGGVLEASWSRLGRFGWGDLKVRHGTGDPPEPMYPPQLTVITVLTVFTVKTLYWAQGT